MSSIASIAELNVYPVKSCAGISLPRAELSATGLAGDRHWMIVNAQGKFLTQREAPRLALIRPIAQDGGVTLSAPEVPDLSISRNEADASVEVTVWRDPCKAFDAGDEAARVLSDFLGQAVRLVRFDPQQQRLSNRDWTGELEAPNQFSDGYPILAISNASLADLNRRLRAPLPMNRFRPNIVLDGLEPYAEDRIYELHADGVRLRVVKPCTRCKITTTDQATGIATGPEPLQTLRSYRWDAKLRGITFGQNVVIAAGVGAELYVGQQLNVQWRNENAA